LENKVSFSLSFSGLHVCRTFQPQKTGSSRIVTVESFHYQRFKFKLSHGEPEPAGLEPNSLPLIKKGIAMP